MWRFLPGMRRCGRVARALPVLVLLPLATPGAAPAAAPVPVRSGDHGDFGRVVFDTPPGATYQLQRDGSRLTVRFDSDVALGGAPKLPRNVLGFDTSGPQAVLSLAAGSTVHDMRVGDHIVLDVFDPAAGDKSAPPVTPNDKPAPPTASDKSAPPHAASPVLRSATASTLPEPPPPPPPLPPPLPSPPLAAPVQPVAAAMSAPATAAEIPRAVAATPPVSLVVPSPTPQAATTSEQPALPPATANPGAASSGPVAAGAPAPGSANATPPTPDAASAQAAAPDATQQAGFTLPFADSVGAAAFRHEGEIWLVFDAARRVDVGAMHDSAVFASLRADTLGDVTLLRMTLPPGLEIGLSRVPDGWRIAALAAAPTTHAITPTLGGREILLAAQAPGRVINLPDVAGGMTLLVGTLRQPDQAMPVRRRSPQFVLPATLQGVVAEPLADGIALRATPSGFVLTTGPGTPALSPAEADTLSDADALTRRFAFPVRPAEQLLQDIAVNTAAAAALPVLERGPKRRAAALAMMALGMGAEAESLLQLASADDAREANSPDTQSMLAIAAILAGRPADATNIDDPGLTGTDEITLWRALRLASLDEHSPRAAADLATAAPLLLRYPPPMRDRLLPLALETMIAGGDRATAVAMLARCGDAPGLDLARAMARQAAGDTNGALALLDSVAAGHDQRARARAAVAAVELRLASGKFDRRQAAEAFDRLLYAWRGDGQELRLRERLADLRQGLGEWREALGLLREAEQLFPDDAADIRARMQATFAAMLRDDAADKLPSLEFVALLDENTDLVLRFPGGDKLQAALADRLLALDLPKRAGPLLEKLMNAAPPDAGRAALGLRLATLRLHEGDTGGALAALTASDADNLPADLVEHRVLLRADAMAQWGDTTGAVATLSALSTAAADEARARILEQAKNWPAAEHALSDYAAKTVPDTGDLDDAARRTLLRLATAAAQAGDQATLQALRERQDARMGRGPLADMFRLLTASPVQHTSDLARAGREMGLARALPGALQTLQPDTRTP